MGVAEAAQDRFFGQRLRRAPASLKWSAGSTDSERELRRIDPPFLLDVRDRQMQIDCEGFQFFGKGRRVEFVIRGNRLMMVWLMVEDAETQAMIDAMTRAYGAPTGRNNDYVAFEHNRVAWRFEPAEILFYAPELDAGMAPDFR